MPKDLNVEEFKARLEEIVTEYQVIEEGRLQGLMEGYGEGRLQGLMEGYGEGYREGYRAGHREGLKEGCRRGITEGFQKGAAALLLRLLEWKFGRLDRQIRARVRGADAKSLLAWGERVLTAERLEDVFTN